MPTQQTWCHRKVIGAVLRKTIAAEHSYQETNISSTITHLNIRPSHFAGKEMFQYAHAHGMERCKAVTFARFVCISCHLFHSLLEEGSDVFNTKLKTCWLFWQFLSLSNFFNLFSNEELISGTATQSRNKTPR